ncbi:helicase C-terminal domain-containing protein [Liquorilactobacillus mali]|uniref:helicase C-terminal domain-containing protein n=1 Tax=Liquorilactobacillus mali TaxID=1618 RepID=UPI0026562F0D|nr:helicase C-terminal domain-containing protein [Liquorilactobacillus mali]MDN7145000.1 helicase C-terminal domain-containing protein [Liquorilactobacillus mali]
MRSTTTYAVVDIETTGTSMDGSNRMLQFSCVFIKNKEIVNTFNTMINPGMPIPIEVQKLTGISDKNVRKAPFFEDMAGTIYSLLQGTVFIAHNINFDYRFLNEEFLRCGYPELNIHGIDTVQLSQIVLPTLPSYRLTYLGEYFDIRHEHPHHADSDAFVTAKLFLMLLKAIDNLPVQVLKIINRFRESLLFQTGSCFDAALKKKQAQTKQLPSYLEVVGDLVLRTETLTIESIREGGYPQTREKKEKLFGKFLEWRPTQSEMMDEVYRLLVQRKEKLLMIEAPTGLGKTLGYLIPALYAAVKGHPSVVSTATTTLQMQLLEQTIPLLRQIMPFNFTVAVLKGSHNYIDLQKFILSLSKPQNKPSRLLQLRIVVWLTMTKTGDLSELHLTKMQDPLFDDITHKGPLSIDSGSVYYTHDFVLRQQLKQATADLIITNHSYLLNHAEGLGRFKKKSLIIDEAQHFGSIALKSNRAVIDFDLIKIISDTLLVKIGSQRSFSFKELEQQYFLTPAESKKIAAQIRVIDKRVPVLRELLRSRFLQKEKKENGEDTFNEVAVKTSKFQGFVKENLADYQKVAKAKAKFQVQLLQLKTKFIEFKNQERLDRNAQTFVLDFLDGGFELLKALENWHRFELDELDQIAEEAVISLQIPVKQVNGHLRLSFGIFKTNNYLSPFVYSKFEHTLFVGAALVLPEGSDYMKNQLDLAPETPVLRLEGGFDYQKQALGLLVADAPDIVTDTERYVAYLGKVIENILSNNNKQTMILFNSLEMISKVYEYLRQSEVFDKRVIIAQGITGSNEKIIKMFELGDSAVLLGSGTFWEGIDLPKDRLELLVITRLPFQPPDTLVNRAKYRLAQSQGQNSFNTIALPEAMFRLKQGLGRLIRTKEDRGIVIVLDSRVVSRNYGAKLREVFPHEMPVRIIESTEIQNYLFDFWEN